MSQIYLKDTFPEHPKVAAAGGDAAWLFVCGLGWLKRNASTTGLIPKVVIPRLSDRKSPMRLAARLDEVGLWHDEGDAYLCHEYVEHNAKAIHISEQRRQAAKSKWAKDGSKRPASAPASADRLQMQNGCTSQVDLTKYPGNQVTKETSSLPSPGSHSSVEPGSTPGAAEAATKTPWGNPEATAPNETPDTRNRRRALAIRWRDVLTETGTKADVLDCNAVVARALHEADWHIVDEQIGWQLTADTPARTPGALLTAVRRAVRA